MLKATLYLCIITLIIYLIDTLAMSLRLVVYRSKQYNLTQSTFNIVSIVAKFAQMFQAPLLGILIDVSIGTKKDPIGDFRMILMFATIGVLIAIAALPSFLKFFDTLVSKIADKGSFAKFVVEKMEPQNIKAIKGYMVVPKKSMFAEFKDIWKFKYLLLGNLLVSSVYTVGVMSAYYGSYLMPNSRLAIAGFSGSINSVASLVMILFLDPQLALITDDSYGGKREYSDLKKVVLILIFSKLLGTLIGQIIFLPSARWIVWVYNLLT